VTVEKNIYVPGGELQSKSRLRSFLRTAIIVVALLFVLGTAGVYAYVRYIEGRFHSNGDLKETQSVISEPTGDEPINTLILGSDARSKKENARSDTIIILRANPTSKKAYFISIPRDMRVRIPGYGWDKINAANSLGGPRLAVQTVEDFTGFTVHHYVEVNFEGFRKMVDKLGGVVIDVEEPLVDKATKFGIPAGTQLMHGARALDYVRFRRDAKGDFGRIERQQKFFRALIDKSFRLQSVFKLHSLITILADNTETDLSSREMLGVANLLKSVDKENVQMVTLPGEVKRLDGKSFVIPQEETISDILEAVEKEEPLQTTAVKGETVRSRSRLKLLVLNGCGIPDIARKVAERLSQRGFKVKGTANAASFDYEKTLIRYREGMYQEAREIAELFPGSLEEPLSHGEEGTSDVVVVVGKDYRE
jgi:LCP family protein required for cell wall assembly